MQLYEKALDLFEDDQTTSVSFSFCPLHADFLKVDIVDGKSLCAVQVIFHRHLLRVIGAPIMDMLFRNLVERFILFFIFKSP